MLSQTVLVVFFLATPAIGGPAGGAVSIDMPSMEICEKARVRVATVTVNRGTVAAAFCLERVP